MVEENQQPSSTVEVGGQAIASETQGPSDPSQPALAKSFTFGIGKVMNSIQENTLEALQQVKPEHYTEQAEQKLQDFKAFKRDVQESLEPIKRDLASLRQKLQDKAYREGDDEEDEEGLLTQALKDYLDCVTIDSDKLELMLTTDEQTWRDNLEQTKENETKLKEQIEELVREQRNKLAEILRPNRYVHKKPANPFRLVKQDLFGEQVHLRDIQFEWPTDKIFELMQEKESLKIESLRVELNELKQIISVQCHLSNGMKSPAFRSLMSNTPQDQIETRCIELPAEKTIHTVRVEDLDQQAIVSVCFEDAQGGKLAALESPASLEENAASTARLSSVAKTLKEDQSIVGIYGVKDESRQLSSLGFILKESTS